MASLLRNTTISRQTVTVVITTAAAPPLLYYTWRSIRYLLEYRHRRNNVEKIPGPPTHFLWGNLHQHPGVSDGDRLLGWWLQIAQQYGSVLRLWFGPSTPVVLVSSPAAVAAVLRTDEPKSTEYGAPYRMILPWLGEGLLVSSGDLWFRNRRLLTPAFHFDILRPYVDVYNEAVEIMMNKWSGACLEGQGSVEMFSEVSLCTLDIILRCAFSYDGDIQKEGVSHPYVVAIDSLTTMIAERLVRPWLYPEWVYRMSTRGRKFHALCRYIHGVSDDVIAKRKQTLFESGVSRTSRYLDFLDILLSARDSEGQGLSDIEIRNEVDTFMFEGHDTTASAISWTLYSLAEHPECQSRARREIDDLLADRDPPRIEWSDLSSLPYLTCCIKEALRLHSPVPFIARNVSRDLDICGYTVPAGTRVTVSTYLLHHNADVWGENHMVFQPDRFDLRNEMDPYAFVPFSAGPRNCIGQHFALNEEKVVIARVLHRYEIELEPGKKTTHLPAAVMRAPDGIHLRIRRHYTKPIK